MFGMGRPAKKIMFGMARPGYSVFKNTIIRI